MFAQASQAPLEPVSVAPAQARSWARLIARIYAVDPLRCRHCGGAMQLIAFIVESAVIVRLLDHLGEPSRALGAATFGPVMAITPGIGQIEAVARFCTLLEPVHAEKLPARGGPVGLPGRLCAVLSCGKGLWISYPSPTRKIPR